jgi:hypothetical protein
MPISVRVVRDHVRLVEIGLDGLASVSPAVWLSGSVSPEFYAL